jgi:hypothetical protein
VSCNWKGLSGACGLSVETLSIAALQRSAWIFDTHVETPEESFGVVERLLRDLGAGRATIAEQLSGWVVTRQAQFTSHNSGEVASTSSGLARASAATQAGEWENVLADLIEL